jgi:hypothetical protein
MEHRPKDQMPAKPSSNDARKDSSVDTQPCRKCGSTRRYKPRPGRKLGACIDCANTSSKRWKERNPDRNKELQRQWRKKNPEKSAEIMCRWRDNHPNKLNAHIAVNAAVRKGELPPATDCVCADCGCQATEYHHEDYSKPLEVIPLCREHHVARHSTNVTLV